MKKNILRMLLIIAIMVSLNGCAQSVSDTNSPIPSDKPRQETSPAVSSADVPIVVLPGATPQAEAGEASELEKVAKEHGLNLEELLFLGSYQVFPLENGTAYLLNCVGGQEILAAYHDGSLYQTRSIYSTIDEIAQGQGEKCLRIFTKGVVFGGDQEFCNFPGSYSVDLAAGKITEFEMVGVNPQGTYGLIRGGDQYVFDNCAIYSDRAVFAFDFAGENTFGGEPGTEITIVTPPLLQDRKGRRAVQIYFNETELNLAKQFVADFNKMEGVVKASFQFKETDFFRGTMLTLEYGDDYYLKYTFNDQKDYAKEFQNFVISFQKESA